MGPRHVGKVQRVKTNGRPSFQVATDQVQLSVTLVACQFDSLVTWSS